MPTMCLSLPSSLWGSPYKYGFGKAPPNKPERGLGKTPSKLNKTDESLEKTSSELSEQSEVRRALGKSSPNKQVRNEGGFRNYPLQISRREAWERPPPNSKSINNEGKFGPPYKPVNNVAEKI